MKLLVITLVMACANCIPVAAIGRHVQSTQGCGLIPLKPPVALGCKDMFPICTCDINGKNCTWQWRCVR